jgi:acyl-CoA synthetase (AMP-forming)/AMP-acid ligase II
MNLDHLGYIIGNAVRLFPDRPALIQEDLELTYRQLDERCNRVARGLIDRGVRPGERVALLWPNDIRYMESMLGAIRAGAVAVPLNIKFGDEALTYVLENSDSVAIVAGPMALERARLLARGTPAIRFVAGPDELQAAEPEFTRPPHDPDDVCFQPYTSGSTGRPKGVLLTHRGQLWNADAMRFAYWVDETERALVAVPVYHKNAGMTLKIHLLAGASVVVLPAFDSSRVIEAIERYRCTYIGGVPAMYRMLVNDTAALARHDVSSLRHASAGSADVPADLITLVEQTFGAPISNGYGMTESGPDVLITPRWGIRKLGSLGPPLLGCEVKLVSIEDDTREVATGEIGELVTRNPGVAVAYYKLPEVTAARIRDGWLYTGDLMRRDEDNYFYFVGRKDDMINVGGENVYPIEVEAILMRHSGVRDVAVVPVSHATKGEVPVAFVIAHTPGEVTEDEIKQFFLTHGPAYAHPRRVFFRDAMPLSATGKLDRAALRGEATEATGAGSELAVP